MKLLAFVVLILSATFFFIGLSPASHRGSRVGEPAPSFVRPDPSPAASTVRSDGDDLVRLYAKRPPAGPHAPSRPDEHGEAWLQVVDSLTGEPVAAELRILDASGTDPFMTEPPLDAFRAIGFGVRFKGDVFPCSVLWFRASAAGYCTLEGKLDLRERAPPRVTLRMLSSIDLEGRVVDGSWRAGKAPVPGVLVQLIAESSSILYETGDRSSGWRFRAAHSSEETFTDLQGEFRISGLLPKRVHRLLVDEEGFGKQAVVVMTPEPVPDAENVVRTTVHLLRARPEGWITGRLLVDGVVVPAAPFVKQGSRWSHHAIRSTTDRGLAEGDFRIRVASGPCEIAVYPKRWVRRPAPEWEGTLLAVPPGGEIDRTFRLSVAFETLSGAVRRGEAPAVDQLVQAHASGGHAFEVRTDERGNYRVDVPDLGFPYRVQASRAHGARIVEALPGDTNVDFTLPSWITIGVRVVDKLDDRALHDALVSVRGAGSSTWLDVRPVDLEGDYQLIRVPPDRLELSFRRDGYQDAAFEAILPRLDGSSRFSFPMYPKR